MKSHISILLSTLLLLVNNACAGPVIPANIKLPDIGIAPNEMNSRIKLNVPIGANTFSTKRFLVIDVEVISKDQIIFPSDYGARLFILQNDQWIEVSNFTTYPKDFQPILEPAGGDILKHGNTSVFPVLPDKNKQVTLLVILTGNIFLNGKKTDEKTSGSVIIYLKP